MRSLSPTGLRKRFPRLPDKMQVLMGAGLLATVVVLYIMTTLSFGNTAAGSASSKRNTVIDKAKEYVKDNFHGVASLEFESESVKEEDGVWKVVFKCEKRPADARDAWGERVTLRLFVNEDSMQVRGLSTNGW